MYTAKVTQALRAAGHDVLILCQEPHAHRLAPVDAVGTVSAEGVSPLSDVLRSAGDRPALSRAAPTMPGPDLAPSGGGVLLRPDIGTLLPVFVYDEYEGFEVKRFVDLTDRELADYLRLNVAALRAAAEWFEPDVVIAGHAVPGPVIARRALGPGSYIAKVHGSDLEYAVRLQERYLDLAREGLEGARAVVGGSADVLARAVELVPAVADRTRVVSPGVEVDLFRRAPRTDALERLATLLEADPDVIRGRPAALDDEVAKAITLRDPDTLDALALGYDQSAPDREVAVRIRRLAGGDRPLIGYLGKFIPQKGVDALLGALATMGPEVHGLVVGFGLFREWLAALAFTLDRGDVDAARWVANVSPLRVDLDDEEIRAAGGLARRVTFTGRLDHRYAPAALAALDILVVPSILEEAFGMVAAEGASAGALPLVARHSGLAEVASALEARVDRPGVFSYQPGPGASRHIATGIRRILSLPEQDRRDLRAAVSGFVAAEWTWVRTAERLLEAAG